MVNRMIKSLTLLLNLDFGSTNTNFVSLYRIFEDIKIIRAMKRKHVISTIVWWITYKTNSARYLRTKRTLISTL